MVDVLISIGFDVNEIEAIDKERINTYNLEKFILLMKKYNCKNAYIRDLILNYSNILEVELDVLEYKLEAIVSNGDIIDEVLMDLI
jgi:hypothetical protein